MKVKRNGNYVRIDDMTWPIHVSDGIGVNGVEWRIRYMTHLLTKSDLLFAASVMAAYQQMVQDPTIKRNKIVKALRGVARK